MSRKTRVRSAFPQYRRTINGVLGGEDFKSALQDANNWLNELDGLSSQIPSKDPSTSTGNGHIATDDTIDRRRLELLSGIVEVLHKHLRARYELRLDNILRA